MNENVKWSTDEKAETMPLSFSKPVPGNAKINPLRRLYAFVLLRKQKKILN